MEADFSGWVTKAGLKCSDGRTIMPDAFKHQDKAKVPLVWQHGHTDPENVLGHVILENREDGVFGYAFFNKSDKAKHAHEAVEHGDINMMSIWANQLIERSKSVFHGAIREVSLVLSGANPGALIENVTIRHSDDEDEIMDDEAIIYTGLEIVHSGEIEVDDKKEAKKQLVHDDDIGELDKETVKKVYASMSEEQQEVMHLMLGKALVSANAKGDDDVEHATGDTVQDVYNSMSDIQKQVLHFMVGEALASADGTDTSIKQDNLTDDDKTKEGDSMKHHNVFEQEEDKKQEHVISHDAMKALVEDAESLGTLSKAVKQYALSHGITDIDMLFPDAMTLDKVPEYLQRRVEWVGNFLGAVRKSPFSRIKTITADITMEEARAKGYIKGTMKKEEWFGLSRRTTTPTTVYKKQALDRDDVVDITDFDVIVWLKGEMRLMLDEELARAALMGDGRDPGDDDKINEGNIRPIAKDNDLFAVTLNINLGDANSSIQEFIDAIVTNRKLYKGTGQPNMYTSETIISRFLLLRDTLGRRIYKDLGEVASELRVAAIIPVEVMEEDDDLLAVIVNPVDYVMGSTAGGQVSMFDDFDIDYNKQKYLIETRLSGALTKLKSALVIRGTAAGDVLVSPTSPTFDADTGALTIVNTTGVVYKNADTDAVINAAGSPYSVASGDTYNVVATPASGYYFATSEDDEWTFTAN